MYYDIYGGPGGISQDPLNNRIPSLLLQQEKLRLEEVNKALDEEFATAYKGFKQKPVPETERLQTRSTFLGNNLSTGSENGSGLDVTPSATVAPPAATVAPPSAKERLAQAEAMLKIGGLLTPPRDDKPPTMTAPGVIPGRAPFAGQDFRLGAGRQRQYFVPQGFLR